MFVHAQGVESSSLQELVAASLLPCLLSVQSLRVQHPSVSRAKGPGQWSCGGVEGKAPHSCLSLLSWEEAGVTHPGASHGRNILRRNEIKCTF